ncbi:hypothetical protein OG292_32885 [Streptomyces sp. NBC_01511]|uniref:hypothetical protein n=1 Tax=unclassified Streptomyces TaxID=2593676 RepID=UPI003865F4AC
MLSTPSRPSRHRPSRQGSTTSTASARPSGSARRALRAGLATLTGVLACTLIGPAPAGAQQARETTARTAEGMAALDFLLGDFSCAYTDLTLPEPTTTTVRWTTEKTLGGAFYEMRLSGSAPAFEGRWVFGRNAIDNVYTTFYWDTWGNTGTATSPGWKRGTLRFEGPYVTPGGHADSKDEFRVVDKNRFTDNAFIRFEGQAWGQISSIDCRRV